MRGFPDNPLKLVPWALVALFFGTRGHWLAEHLRPWHMASLLAAGGLVGWIWNHRRYRQFADTPSCAIAAAPQGYVRLSGIGRPIAGTPLLSPAMHGFAPLPCLWYRIKVEERDSDDHWHTVFEDESDDAFLIVDDDGGQCVVDPAGASIITGREENNRMSGERSSLWLLVAGTRLAVSGHFLSHSAHGENADLQGRVRDKLADWKDAGQIQRFDLDGDGEVDMREWTAARAAAQREVRNERAAELTLPATHSLRRPSDGRPYIISDRRPEQVVRSLRWQSWSFLLLFFAGVGGLAWSLGA